MNTKAIGVLGVSLMISSSFLTSTPQVKLETLNHKNISELKALHKISSLQNTKSNDRGRLQNSIYYVRDQ